MVYLCALQAVALAHKALILKNRFGQGVTRTFRSDQAVPQAVRGTLRQARILLNSMEKEIEIKELEEQLRQAMLASDVAKLDRLLSPDLVFTNHLGQVLGKEADLSAHVSGALSIAKLEPSDQQIRLINADTAVVTVRVRIAGAYAGRPAGGDFRFTRVWAQTPNTHWQVVAAHAGTVA